MTDSSILNTALPKLSIIFNTTPLDLKSTLVMYLIGITTTMPLSNYLIERFGIKKILCSSMLIFIFASLLCGLAPSIQALNLFRLLQGGGAGLSLPIARLLILKNFSREEFFQQMNNIILIVSCGTLFGPLIGGIIIKYFAWQWLFWINIPLSLLIIIVTFCHLPDFSSRYNKFDWKGFILLCLSLSALVQGLSKISQSHHMAIEIIILLGTFIIGFTIYLIYSKQTPKPIINLTLFNNKTFSLGFYVGILSRTCLGGIPFILPLLLQILLKKDPIIAGITLIPIAGGVIISKTFAKKLNKKWSLKQILIGNTILMSIFLATISQLDFHKFGAVNFLIFTGFGIFQSIQYASANAIAYQDIPEPQYSTATVIMSLQQQLSISLGIAFSAILLNIFCNNHGLDLATFQNTFLVLSLFSLSIIPIIFRH